MNRWTLWNDQGKLSTQSFTEEEARELLQEDKTGTVYAENATGDCITRHDGPVTIARTEGRLD